MESQKYEKMLRAFFNEVINQKDLNAIPKFLSQDILMHDGKTTIKGIDEGKRILKERNAAIPDFHCTLDDIIIMGEKAAVRWHCTGKALKDFADFKAEKNINYSGITIFEMKDNHLIRLWEYGTAVDV